MSHMLVPGVDRVAATRARTIWHNAETLANGVLRDFPTLADAEATYLSMAGWVFPTDADNDVVRTIGLVTADGTPIESHMATLSRTGRVLGVVGSDYNPVSFKSLTIDLVYSLVLAGAAPETLGTFDAGRNMFASVLVAEPFRVPGDEHYTHPYFNLTANHTGQGGIRGSFATFRPVCRNTAEMYDAAHAAVSAVEKQAAQAWIMIKHTSTASARIKDAVAWIVDGKARAERTQALLAEMANRNLTANQVGKFVEGYIASGETSRAESLRAGQRDAFYQATQAADLGAHARTASGDITAYGLFQAVTHFEDWMSQVRRTNDQPEGVRRAFRAFLGEREPSKARARELIMAL